MEKQNTSVIQLFYGELEGEMWKYLSKRDDIHWNLDFLETNKDNLDWASLSENASLPWSIQLIETYQTLWDWERLSKKLSCKHRKSIYMEVVDRWPDRVNWDDVSSTSTLTVEIASKFVERLNWSLLCANRSFKWTMGFAQSNIERIDWAVLSQTLKLHSVHDLQMTLSEGLIKDLSTPKQPIIEFIECFIDRWDWDALSQNGRLEFNTILLHAFRKHWNWSLLLNNPRVLWSFAMVEQFKSYIPTADVDFLKSSHMWQMLLKEKSKDLFIKCLADDVDVRLLVMRL